MRAICLIISLLLAGAAAAHDDKHPKVDVLLETGVTNIGQPLEYPDGAVNITAVIVTVPPGAQTGWHKHEVPLVAYMLEGEVTLDYGNAGIKVFKTGDAFIEAFKSRHNGKNMADVPAKIFAVFAGSDGAKNTVSLD